MEENSISVKNEVKSEFQYEEMDADEASEHTEEGEISSDSDDDQMNHHGSSERSNYLRQGFDNTGLDENQKRLERAKRFALHLENKQDEKTQISKLYDSLGIDSELIRHYRLNAIHLHGLYNMNIDDVYDYFNKSKPSYVEWISDTSCNIVWLDDISAAKAMLDLSKRIKNMHLLNTDSEDSKNILIDPQNQDIDEDAIDAREINIQIPPGQWRAAKHSPCRNTLLFRFATNSDNKEGCVEKYRDNIPGLFSRPRLENTEPYLIDDDDDKMVDGEAEKKNPWGDLAQSWGRSGEKVEINYIKRDFIPKPSLLNRAQSDLRNTLINKSKFAKVINPDIPYVISDDESIEFSRRKIPKMKMVADNEEKYVMRESRALLKPARRVHDLRSKLSATITIRNTSPAHVRSRSLKVHRSQSESEDSSSSEKNDRARSRRTHRKEEKHRRKKHRRHTKTKSDVKQYNSESEESSEWALEGYTELLKSLGHDRPSKVGILEKNRMKSQKRETEDEESEELSDADFGRKSPLQIEIDNDKYFEQDSD